MDYSILRPFIGEPLRILHIYKTYYPEEFGGVQLVIHNLCEGAQRLGHNAEVFTLSSTDQPPSFVCDHHLVNRSRRFARVASMDFSFGSISSLRRLVSEFDILHYHFPWPWMDVMHLFLGCAKPCVVTYHSDVVKQRILKQFYKPLQKWFLSRMDRIVATSPNYAATSPVLSMYQEKLKVIPLGIDPAAYNVLPGRLNLWRKRMKDEFLLFVGAFRYYKGIECLLEAAENYDGQIALVGGGYCEKALRGIALEKKLDNVVFLGQLADEDKCALLKLCSGFVLPSHLRSEAFGLAAVEAQFFSKPLITCEVGTGTSFVNIDGVTGIVVPPNDPHALTAAMRELRDAPARAREMGQNGKERLNKLFTLDAMVQSYLTLYKDLIQDSSRSL
ncbi:MAG: glycosyltransferase [Planctomycetaceae bacterium]|nr:glycosyltransferase [Planctomycetaceae bacterium]